jgi:hypothetical protein
MAATMVTSMIGIFFGIYLLFVNAGLAFRVLAAILDWGSLACGITLFTYGTYLFCTFLLHLRQVITPDDLHHSSHRQRAIRSTVNSGFFVAVLYIFAFLAIARAG